MLSCMDLHDCDVRDTLSFHAGGFNHVRSRNALFLLSSAPHIDRQMYTLPKIRIDPASARRNHPSCGGSWPESPHSAFEWRRSAEAVARQQVLAQLCDSSLRLICSVPRSLCG